MSTDATGWVLRHSPHKGATLLVHLAVADSVNDLHDNEFWMGQERLALKTRLSRGTVSGALTELVAGGYLERLSPDPVETARWDGAGRAGDGRPVRYRFVFVQGAPVVYEARRVPVGISDRSTEGDLSADRTGPVVDSYTEPKDNPTGSSKRKPLGGRARGGQAPQEPITDTAPTPEEVARTAELAAQARLALREGRSADLREDSAPEPPEAVTSDPRPPDAAERALPPSDR